MNTTQERDVRVIFVTYGNQPYAGAKARIVREAQNMHIFSDVYALGPADLAPSFLTTHRQTLQVQRGAGLWCWKPQICLQILDSAPDGTILFYCDAGCTLNVNGRQRLLEYITLVSENDAGILAFQMQHPEHKWTKQSLLSFLQADHLAETGQLVGGIFFVRKCEKSIQVLKRWRETMAITSLVDDSPSAEPNHSSFKQNRHDQSVWSLLVKSTPGATIISPDETYPFHKHLPIWATRKKN